MGTMKAFDKGYILIHRKAFKENTGPLCKLAAWFWLIAAADYNKGSTRGTLTTNLGELARAWKWTSGKSKQLDRKAVKRTLEAWIRKNQIKCHSNATPVPLELTKSATRLPLDCHSIATISYRYGFVITIVKYDTYQNGKSSQENDCHSIATPVPLDCHKSEEQVPHGRAKSATPASKTDSDPDRLTPPKEERKKELNTVLPSDPPLRGEPTGDKGLKTQTKGAKKTNPQIAQTMTFFCENYLEIIGEPYPVAPGDGKLIQGLLGVKKTIFAQEEVHRRMIAFLKDPLDWQRRDNSTGTMHTLTVFQRIFPRYASTVKTATSERRTGYYSTDETPPVNDGGKNG